MFNRIIQNIDGELGHCVILSIIFQVYPKLAQAYFLLLECLAQDHMAFLSTLDPAIFLYIIKSISEGLAAEGMTNLTSSDATGDLSKGRYFLLLSLFGLNYFHSFCLKTWILLSFFILSMLRVSILILNYYFLL